MQLVKHERNQSKIFYLHEVLHRSFQLTVGITVIKVKLNHREVMCLMWTKGRLLHKYKDFLTLYDTQGEA